MLRRLVFLELVLLLNCKQLLAEEIAGNYFMLPSRGSFYRKYMESYALKNNRFEGNAVFSPATIVFDVWFYLIGGGGFEENLACVKLFFEKTDVTAIAKILDTEPFDFCEDTSFSNKFRLKSDTVVMKPKVIIDRRAQSANNVLDFAAFLTFYFGADLTFEHLRTSQQRTKARNSLNQWVSRFTHKKINRMLPDEVSLGSVYLTTPIYFCSSWLHKFSVIVDHKHKFKSLQNGHIVQQAVKMMSVTEKCGNFFDVFELTTTAGLIKGARLPFALTNSFMFIYMPEDPLKFTKFLELWEEKLYILAEISEGSLCLGESGHKHLKITMPKFFINERYKSVNLKPLLNEFGMGMCFEDSEITTRKEVLNVHFHIYHNAMLSVNEFGIEKFFAPDSAFEATESLKPEVKTVEMIVDRPFFFQIVKTPSTSNTNGEMILYAGQITDIESAQAIYQDMPHVNANLMLKDMVSGPLDRIIELKRPFYPPKNK